MRAARYILAFIAAVVVATVFLLLAAISPLGPWWRLHSLERQVKRNMDPAELQQWACELLARHPGENVYYMDYYGTNLPAGLKKVSGFYHWVRIGTGDEFERRVVVFGGTRVEPYLLVGSPTFVYTNAGAVLWKPGIYFVTPAG